MQLRRGNTPISPCFKYKLKIRWTISYIELAPDQQNGLLFKGVTEQALVSSYLIEDNTYILSFCFPSKVTIAGMR